MILRTDLRADRLARHRRADRAGARLFRRDARVRRRSRCACSPRTTTSSARPPTDADGVGRFAAPLLHGEGPVAPRAHRRAAAARTTRMLDLQQRRLRPVGSRRGGAAASGAARRLCLAGSRHLPAGRDGAGDGAAARQCRASPPTFPAHVIVKRPNGQVFLDTTPARGGGGVGASAGGAVGRRAGRHLDHRGEGRSRPGRRSAGPSSASMPSCPIAWRWTSAPATARSCPARPTRCR